MESVSREGSRGKIAQVLDTIALFTDLQSESSVNSKYLEGKEISECVEKTESLTSAADDGFPLTKKRKLTETAENDEADVQSSEDQEFVWEDYLSETGSIAAPPMLFVHVEQSLENGYKEGMKMEVPNLDVPGTYWVATVITICGPLLSLRYIGCNDDRSMDFWWDATKAEVHALGWCLENSKQLIPPEAVREKHENPESLLSDLKDAATIPCYLLDVSGTTLIDFIKQGMKLEVQEEMNPANVWIVTVLENVGGRLLLRYDGLESAYYDFWLFYLSVRLHLIGWASDNSCNYQPPQFLKYHHTNEAWLSVIQKAKNESMNMRPLCEIFQAQETVVPHLFQVGMKLEALHPVNKFQLCPATVTHVLSNYYFLVVIDDVRNESEKESTHVSMCCHSKCSTLFPVKWSVENRFQIQPPQGCASVKL